MGGFFGFFDYNKPGKGVEKEDFKPNFTTFFRIFFERFWKLIQLNLIYIICSIPLIAVMVLYIPMGAQSDEEQMLGMFRFYAASLLYISVVGFAPASTGFTYVLRNFSSDRHAWVFSDFFEQIKKNFKQSLAVMIIDAVVVIAVPFLYSFYTNVVNSGGDVATFSKNMAFVARAFIVIFAAVYFMMHFYMYQIMVTFDMKLKEIYKNSLIFTLAHLPRNIGIFILISLVAVLTFGYTTTIGIILAILICISLIGYIVNFIVQPVITKHMIKS